MAGRHINREKALGIVERVLAAGHTYEAAAAAANIDRATLWRWMDDAKIATKLEMAEGRAELKHAGTVLKSAADDPEDAKWWLNRRRPKTWGEQQRVEITGDVKHILALDPLIAIESRSENISDLVTHTVEGNGHGNGNGEAAEILLG